MIAKDQQQTSYVPSGEGTEWRVRAALPHDQAGILDLVQRVFPEFELVFDAEGPDRDLLDIEGIYFKRGGSFEVIVNAADEVIGTIGLIRLDEHTGKLRKMYIDPRYRGRGLGALLLRRAIAFAEHAQLERIILDTVSNMTTAIRLYESHGFVRASGGIVSPRCNLFMKKTLVRVPTMSTAITIRPAVEADLPVILDIYNEVIANTTAAYVYEPHTLAMRQQWYAELKAGGWPVIVAERDGAVVGFGCIGEFRHKPGYKYTGEHTVHVHAAHRGQGIGRTILLALIEEARKLELRTLIGGIDAANATSIALHANLGFVECARIEQVAYKFGRWLDLVLMQLVLPGPKTPIER